MATHVVGPVAGRQITLEKLDGIAWGLFFLWVGIVLLADFGWGTGLLGIGIVILGGQAGRKLIGAGFELFWVLVGMLFFLGGVWELFGVRVGLTPILCIVAGVLLLLSALLRKPNE